MKNRAWTLVLWLTLAISGSQAAQAQSTPVTTCGQVLSAPGDYHLTANLGPCTGDGVVITASDVRLSLAGFTISGTSSATSCDTNAPQLGINATAPVSGLHIYGGTVAGFVDGVALYASNSRVSAMTVKDNCVFGITVSGANNDIDTNVVTGSGTDGVVIVDANNITVHSNDISGNTRFGLAITSFSDRNTIRNNVFRQNGLTASGAGVFVANGNKNRIHDNAANENFDGISLSTLVTGSLIQDNTTNGNTNAGIAIGATATKNDVRSNRARGNGTADLSDGNAGCDSNTWRRNLFGTDSVAGASDGGPGTGCIR